MAFSCAPSCDICTHDFNEVEHKSVALPCGHDFCLTCLVRLEKSGGHKCPKCRKDWSGLKVEALPGMEGDEEAGQQGQGSEKDDNGKKDGDQCLNHQYPFVYWCVDENEFHCNKCIVVKRCLQLELIDEAIPLIKTDLSRRVTETLEQNQTDLGELEQLKNEVRGKLNMTKRYKEAVQKVEDDLQDCITKIEVCIVEKRKSSTLAEHIRGKIEKVKSQLDVPLVVKSRTTLEALSKPTAVPDSEIYRALLCNIASVYMEVTGLNGPPSEAAFVRGLLMASGGSVGMLKEVVRAAEELEEGREWTVDSSNCLAALVALADRQPSILTLKTTGAKPEALPARHWAAVAKAARDCEVLVKFFDSFYEPQDSKRDSETLDYIVNKSSLRLTEFVGHLDTAGIAKLPHTIWRVGLAIGSAADATAVSGLQPWEGLSVLDVSVSFNDAAQDLRPLPSVRSIYLYLPGLTDALVDSVRPAIEALVGNRMLDFLTFPRNQLTAGGARRLVGLLHGARIDELTFSDNLLWQPAGEEKISVEAELRRVVGCRVEFN